MRHRVLLRLARQARGAASRRRPDPGPARNRPPVPGTLRPLIPAPGGRRRTHPLLGHRFDLAISECGASLWCDPARWIPEAARLLRPGGRLVFHTTTVLVAMCQPGLTGYAGQELLRPQREVSRLQSPGYGVESHPSQSECIQILRKADFAIDALHDLYAPPDASTHPYYKVATAHWAQQWPVEEIWVTHVTPEDAHVVRETPQ
jgi:SAM-dependent methyltransferase